MCPSWPQVSAIAVLFDAGSTDFLWLVSRVLQPGEKAQNHRAIVWALLVMSDEKGCICSVFAYMFPFLLI